MEALLKARRQGVIVAAARKKLRCFTHVLCWNHKKIKKYADVGVGLAGEPVFTPTSSIHVRAFILLLTPDKREYY